MPTIDELLALRDSLQQRLDAVRAEVQATDERLAGVLAETESRKRYKAELEAKVQALEAEVRALRGD